MNQWLLLIGEGSVVRQRESDFSVHARVCQAILSQKEGIQYIILFDCVHCQENKLLFY